MVEWWHVSADLCVTADLCLKQENDIFTEALIAIFSILYPFWPLIILLGIRRLRWNDQPFLKRVQRGLVDILIAWLIWAFLWGFILWHERSPVLIFSTQVNNLTFILLGATTGGILIAKAIWHWHSRWMTLTRARKLEDLKKLSPQDFETLVARLFKTYGHEVDLVGGHADHGVDIVVKNGQGEKWIVQCKRYGGSVGEPVLRDLYGTLLHEEAQGAYLITTGTITQGATQWAVSKPIILYDGEALIKLIHKAKIRRGVIGKPETK